MAVNAEQKAAATVMKSQEEIQKLFQQNEIFPYVRIFAESICFYLQFSFFLTSMAQFLRNS